MSGRVGHIFQELDEKVRGLQNENQQLKVQNDELSSKIASLTLLAAQRRINFSRPKLQLSCMPLIINCPEVFGMPLQMHY